MLHTRTADWYHLAHDGEILAGRTVHIEDHPDGRAAILLHPDHIRTELCQSLNRVHHHILDHGLWRQRWTDDGRLKESPKGLGFAVARWEIIPAHRMPASHLCIPVEEDGSCVWLLREDYCTKALRDEMNQMLERIAGDGLWLQRWQKRQRWTSPSIRPQPVPPAGLLLV